MRATRTLVHGDVIGEIGNGTISTNWTATGLGAASACIEVTQGDWSRASDTARQCVNLTITQGGNPGTDVAIPPTPTPPPAPSNGGNNGGGNNGGGGNPGSSNSCNSALSFLNVGAIAKVENRVNVRDGIEGRTIEELSPGKLVTIIGGPGCRSGSLMWEIGYDGKRGWAAEVTSANFRYLSNNTGGGSGNNSGGNNGSGSSRPPANPTARPQQPSQPSQPGNSGCNSLTRLSIGDTASVADATPDPVPMRTGPATSYSIIMQVAVREYVVVTGGPSCPDNLVWWEVRKDGRTGWMAEINRFNNRNLIFVEGGGSTQPGTNDCGPGWTPPEEHEIGDVAWESQAKFSITLQDLRMENRRHLETIVNSSWWESGLETIGGEAMEQAFTRLLKQAGIVLNRSLSIIEIGELFFGGGVQNAFARYSQTRTELAEMEFYRDNAPRCGNFIQLPLSILDRPSTSFPFLQWAGIIFEYVPGFYKREVCNLYPDTCEALGQ